MADYTLSKQIPGMPMPEDAQDASWSRYEPLMSAEAFEDRIVPGIPLRFVGTNKPVTEKQIDAFIQDAVAKLEEQLGIEIFPTQHYERQAFDRNLYQTMGYMKLRHRPVQSVESLAVITSNEQNIWSISLDWIDSGYLSQGLIYIVPINIAVQPSSVSGNGAGGAAFLAILGQQPWVPAYWRVRYTTGYKDGKLPRIINLLIGIQAGIDLLSKLQASNARFGSKSIGLDGLSQSSSNPGPQLYKEEIERLMEEKKLYIKKVKAKFGTNLFTGEV